MQRHDWSTSPKEPMLHLSLSPCTGSQLQLASSSRPLMLAYRTTTAQHPPTSTHYYESTSPPEAPPTFTHYYESTSPQKPHLLPLTLRIYIPSRSPVYFHSLLRIYIPLPRVWYLLVSDALCTITREAQNHSPELSLSPIPGRVEWSSTPPPPIRDRWIPVNLQATTENSSLSNLIDFILNFKNKTKEPLCLSLYLFLPLLACTYLNNVWDLMLQALPLSVCLFKINRFMYSPIVSRFG